MPALKVFDRVIRIEGTTPVLVSGDGVLCRCRIKHRSAKHLVLLDPMADSYSRIEEGPYRWETEEEVDLILPSVKAVKGTTIDFQHGAGKRQREVFNCAVTRVVVLEVLRRGLQ
jgi:hypothetical protein